MDNDNVIIDQQENIEHVDGNVHEEETLPQSDAPMSHHPTTSDTNDALIKRPVKIAHIAWANGSTVFQKFDPWSLYMRNRLVSNRLNHFKNFTGTLCVKFMLNGNQFHSGLLWAVYNPLPAFDEVTQLRSNKNIDLMEASQRPYVSLSPGGSNGGVLKLPFVHANNAIDLTLNEESLLGTISLVNVNTLKQANGGNKPVYITITAWLEDYDISTPTSHQYVGLQNQIQNQTEHGLVSGPAHAIANAAGKLSNVPYIGKGAKTASSVASAMGSVAQLFGFSKPAELNQQRTVIKTASNGATTEGQSHSKPLSMSPVKEVTLDPATMWASDTDEMAIASISQRECYVRSFNWSNVNAADTHLMSIRCGPCYARDDPVRNQNYSDWHVTPSTWVSLPFKYWTGSTKFRLEVVAAKVHAGRLRVAWDPIYTKDPTEYNMNYSAIIDIEETREMTFQCGWGQTKNYLEIPEEMEDMKATSIEPLVSRSNFYNGVLSVYVVNPLVIPSDDDVQSVTINIYQSMVDDFELAEPRNLIARAVRPVIDIGRSDLTIDAPPGPDDVDVAPAASNPNNPSQIAGSQRFEYDVKPYYFFRPISITNEGPFSYPSVSFSAFNTQFSDDWVVAGTTPLQSSILGSIAPTDTNVNFGVRAFVTGDTDYSFTQNDVVKDGRLTGVSDTDFVTFTPGEWAGTTTVAMNLSQRAYIGPVGYAYQPTVEIIYDQTGPNFVSDLTTMKDYFPVITERLLAREGTFNGNSPSADQSLSARSNAIFQFIIPENVTRSWVVVEYSSDTLLFANVFTETGSLIETVILGANPERGWACFSNRARVIQILADDGSNVDVRSLRYRTLDLLALDDQVQNQSEAGTTHYFGPPCPSGTNSIFFGEQVASIRQILKREHTAYSFNTGSNAKNKIFLLPHFPVNYRDAIPASPEGTLFIKNHLLEYFSRGFMAMRGGMRIKAIMCGRANDSAGSFMIVRRVKADETLAGYVFDTVLDMEFAGSEFEHTAITGNLDIELPWYSNKRFAYARSTTVLDHHDTWYQFITTSSSSNTFLFNYSTAEDFTLAHFLCTPLLRTV